MAAAWTDAISITSGISYVFLIIGAMYLRFARGCQIHLLGGNLD
jgi:hypothetical protein